MARKKEEVPVPELPKREGGEKIVMGIDPSLNNTAISIGVFRDGITTFSTEVFKMKNKWSQTEKMCRIQSRFRKLLKKQEKYDEVPQLAVIEGFSYGSNMHRETLGAVAFIIRMLLWRFGIHTMVISPHTIKRFLKSGNMKKDQILKEVYKEYGEDFNTHDEADAFVCMQIGMVMTLVQSEIPIDEKAARIKCAEDILKGKVGDLVLPR